MYFLIEKDSEFSLLEARSSEEAIKMSGADDLVEVSSEEYSSDDSTYEMYVDPFVRELIGMGSVEGIRL